MSRKAIAPTPPLPDDIRAEIERNQYDLQIGALYIDDDGDYARITGLRLEERHGHPTLMVSYQETQNSGKTWPRSTSQEAVSFTHHHTRIDVEPGETLLHAIKRLESEAAKAMQNPALLQSRQPMATETSIVAIDNAAQYEHTRQLLDQQKRRVDAIRMVAQRRVRQMEAIADKLSKQLSNVQQIIGMLELYLGVRESVVALRSGKPASEKTPVSIRQLTLYFDEEVGVTDDGGVDFSKLELFDAWLMAGDHLDLVLPEAKGIVAFKPSRQQREYSDNAWVNAETNRQNQFVYLLIRNGDNVYRVYTAAILGDTFFPTRAEDDRIAALFAEAAQSGWESEKTEQKRRTYLRNALIVQGLIDRTDIFQPLPGGRIDLFAPATFDPGGPVQLIRDAEALLPEGRLSFSDWQKAINAQMQRGSRIVIAAGTDFGYYGSEKKWYAHRFPAYFNYPPEPPRPGVYVVEEKFSEKRDYDVRILYLPYQYTFAGDWRTKRVSFRLYRDEYLNYDGIGLDDIEFYLNNRLERRNYLRVLPLLRELRRARLQEIEAEKAFVALMAQKIGYTEQEIWGGVAWWKFKNIWKRPLTQDDAKAWRMIRARLARQRAGQPDPE